MRIIQNRRTFVAGLAVAAMGLFNCRSSQAAGEAPPETTSVRLPKIFPASCDAANYVAAELLRSEGLSDARYVEIEAGVDSAKWIAEGKLDFDVNYGPTHLKSIETGVPIVVLMGLHSGCLELFANESINSILDLKGKRVGVFSTNSSPHVLIRIMTDYVGLDPERDFEWVISPDKSPMELFIGGQIDAFLATPPEPQELRAKNIGHTILNTTIDHPWSEYYCCMLAGTTDYVAKYPATTKRVLRALCKAADICFADPQAAAKTLMEGGFAANFEYTFQSLKDVRYDRWRDFDPEDTLRFFALRMYEAGMIQTAPQQLLTGGTNWTFLNELKREMKT
jgi:NitT/TauT family transport system substrate-binding protein